MTDVDALTAFIRARLDEEEADAKAATPGPWTSGDHPANECRIEGPGGFTIYDEGGHTGADARHIVRQDPAATLARVAALRALVGRATTDLNHLINVFRDEYIDGIEQAREDTLRDLANIWADHPDWPPP